MDFRVILAILLPLFPWPTIAAAAPSIKGGASSSRYIVELKAGVSQKDWLQRLRLPANTVQWDLVNGFAATLNDDDLRDLRASSDVVNISEDGITSSERWQGLSHSSNYQFPYNDAAAGAGVDIYVFSFCVMLKHRFHSGVDNMYGQVTGTYISSVVAGTRWGVAKNVSAQLSQILTDVLKRARISGLDWIAKDVKATKRPAVVHLHSTRGPDFGPSDIFDNAVANIGAGDENQDVLSSPWPSPARVPSVITVGAVDINDARSSFSNYGPAVDIFAPGTNVFCADVGNMSTSPYRITNNLQGLTLYQASSVVAGIVAYLISKDGNVSPAVMKEKLVRLGAKGVISGIPNGTANVLAQLGPP
ncbi:serine proteinase [Coprinopsis marcescibilis]|uniref:Serine proteinase n=1 Tax=Coprinopsis marcescibilis TaxID=230819 RepID=A0A5C3KC27_COPMA|nr:serine proteinase [Coprinopsis marcescibilis]